MTQGRLDQALRPLESAAFAAAAIGYLLPFATSSLPYSSGVITGLQFAGVGLTALVTTPFLGFVYFGMFDVPLIAAIAGFFYRRSARPRGVLLGLAFATAGFAGLAGVSLWPNGFQWDYGFHIAEGALLLAATIGVARLVRAAMSRAVPDGRVEEEPALSAQQELVRRFLRGR